jgi:hypothetical protein
MNFFARNDVLPLDLDFWREPSLLGVIDDKDPIICSLVPYDQGLISFTNEARLRV